MSEKQKKSLILKKIKDKLEETARDTLPQQLKNITKKQAYGFLFFSNATAIVIFTYFCYQSYTVQIKAVFLALDKRSGICYDVPRAITGEFLASDKGYWSGTDGFKSNEAIYRVQFSNLYVTFEEFADLFQSFNDNYIKPLGLKAKNSPSQYNLLTLMYYSAKINKNGYLQKLDFLVEPPIIFAGRKFMGLLNKNFIYTDVPDRIEYNEQNGRTTYNIDVEKMNDEEMNGFYIESTNVTISHVCLMNKTYFQNQSNEYNGSPLLSRYVKAIDNAKQKFWTLADIIPLHLLNYNPQFGSNLALEFDPIAVTGALAVNLGILPFEDLINPGYGSVQSSYKNVTYDLSLYIVDKYSYMSPMICLKRLSGEDPTALYPFEHYCFYKVGSYHPAFELPMLGIPSFMNMGYNSKSGLRGTDSMDFYFPFGPLFSKCTCPQVNFFKVDFFGNPTDELQEYECNLFNYFTSVAFFPNSDFGHSESDPFGTWFFSGSPVYCDAVSETLSEKLCRTLGFLMQCPDYGKSPDTTAYLSCANPILRQLTEEYFSFGFEMQIGPLIDLATKYSSYELNELIYNASIASIGPFYVPDSEGLNCPNDFNQVYDLLYMEYNPTSFCDDACTVLVTTNDDGYLSSLAVNSYLRQTEFLSCNDSFSISNDANELLKKTPPVQLIEQYVKCSAKPVDAIQNAIGIATGWVGLILPIAIMISIAVISFYYSYFVGELPPTDEDVKEAELDDKLNFILKKCEELKNESASEIASLRLELTDTKKMTTLTQVDLHRLHQKEKEKEKGQEEKQNDVLKTITFGLV